MSFLAVKSLRELGFVSIDRNNWKRGLVTVHRAKIKGKSIFELRNDGNLVKRLQYGGIDLAEKQKKAFLTTLTDLVEKTRPHLISAKVENLIKDIKGGNKIVKAV